MCVCGVSLARSLRTQNFLLLSLREANGREEKRSGRRWDGRNFLRPVRERERESYENRRTHLSLFFARSLGKYHEEDEGNKGKVLKHCVCTTARGGESAPTYVLHLHNVISYTYTHTWGYMEEHTTLQ